MESMIDRVSKAISDHFEDGLEWRSYEGAAKAAIEALREPTNEMIDARFKILGSGGKSQWQAMIDAALVEKR